MPTRNRNFLRMLLPFGLLAVGLLALIRRGGDDWEYETAEDEAMVRDLPRESHAGRRRSPAVRFALVAAFTALFFAGAAFTAGAGDQLAKMLDPDDAAALAAANSEAATAEAPAEDAAPAATAETAPAAPDEVAEALPAVAEALPASPEAVLEVAEALPEVAEALPAAPELAPEAAAAPESVPEVVEAAEVSVAAEPTLPAEPNTVVANAPLPQGGGKLIRRPVGSSAVASKAPAPKIAPAKFKAPTAKKWVLKRAAAAPAPAPEIEHGFGEPTIWLNRALPDPTPASARLTRRFAHQLVSVSRHQGADWAAVLGVLRAQGDRGSAPATTAELTTVAARIANQEAWRGALALSGRTAFADRADAFADLYRAVGIEALVTGFEAAKKRLAKRLLAEENVWIYGGGRDDIAAGRVDVRILVVLSYLKERHGSITVSSLFSGHSKFSRPGVVSAHTYGHAVDIAAVGEISIAGHQQPGGITEAAVRSLLLLPAELQPQQVISLLGLGGPSFPMRDHGDHIHVGF
jgi:hypothetical protein